MTLTASEPVRPLPSQRHLFDLPDDVCYLEAAAWAPLPRAAKDAGARGMLAKSEPWTQPRDAAAAWAERVRTAAGALIGAGADDIAIVGSVSHGIATAARNLPLPPGGRILRVADEFPSQCLAWDVIAAERGLSVEVVPRPADGDWTAALAAAIARPGAPPLAVAALTPLHWADGSVIDLERLAPLVRAAGAALVVDATQAVGAVPVDVRALQPDFLAFPTYKWVLGPYSLALLYAAPHQQDGRPLEENSGNQRPVRGARRYDRGELLDPIALPIAATGLELAASWDRAALAARLRDVTDALAEGVTRLGLGVTPRPLRAPHILGATVPGGVPKGLIERLRAEHVFVSERLGGLRLSPHAWVVEADVERCLAALGRALGRALG
jgi:selenocysteine lyase/cysteine desulfurase